MMYRAQAIKRRVERSNAVRKPEGRIRIMAAIDWMYKEYRELCAWCGEQPKPLGKWLLEKVNEVN